MTPPMFPFKGPEWITNIPGYYEGYVCHSCPKTGLGYDLVVPYGWTVKSCQPISSGGGHGCASHLYVALVTVVHRDYEGETTYPIEVKSIPPGAEINVI